MEINCIGEGSRNRKAASQEVIRVALLAMIRINKAARPEKNCLVLYILTQRMDWIWILQKGKWTILCIFFP